MCCLEGSAAAGAFTKTNTIMGDADSDNTLNIVDATLIQMYIAHLQPLNGTQTASSDFNFDGEINILDPVEIQMTIALLN